MMPHDIVIRGARVIDGTGAAGVDADVYLRGDQISAIRPGHAPEPAAEVVEAGGLVLAPGFIDVHTHDDMALIHTPEMRAKVTQGVTTVITGLCGYSPAPLPLGAALPEEYGILIPEGGETFQSFTAYLAAVDAARPAVNSLALVGHSTLRIAAMADLARGADAVELARMCDLLDQALAEGAAGLSSGLAYAMAEAAPTEELVALCARMAGRRAPYVTHVRNEADDLIEAVAEALAIGRRAQVPVILSHHKALGTRNHGAVLRTLDMIDTACACQAVGLDVYPYTYSSTSLTPARAARGGEIVVTRSGAMPAAAGRSLNDVAAELGCDPIEAARRLQPAGGLFHLMAEADVRRVLSHPLTMIGSDGLPFDLMPHPRLWGTFPRVLGHYVREAGVLSLEIAIHKMTGLPATVFAIPGRGIVAEGAYADLVLLDPATVGDRAGPLEPTAPSTGIKGVWINGRPAGRGTGRRLLTQPPGHAS